jgi:CheY-like chemotaxis protein
MEGCVQTVLVVEDSDTQALRLQAFLEKAGYQVFRAENGRQGLEMARALLPDVVVLDLEMPEMTGMEVCAALQAAPDTVAIPVVMLTAHDESETVLSGLALGAVDFIPKDAFADEMVLASLRQRAAAMATGSAAPV